MGNHFKFKNSGTMKLTFGIILALSAALINAAHKFGGKGPKPKHHLSDEVKACFSAYTPNNDVAVAQKLADFELCWDTMTCEPPQAPEDKPTKQETMSAMMACEEGAADGDCSACAFHQDHVNMENMRHEMMAAMKEKCMAVSMEVCEACDEDPDSEEIVCQQCKKCHECKNHPGKNGGPKEHQ